MFLILGIKYMGWKMRGNSWNITLKIMENGKKKLSTKSIKTYLQHIKIFKTFNISLRCGEKKTYYECSYYSILSLKTFSVNLQICMKLRIQLYYNSSRILCPSF